MPGYFRGITELTGSALTGGSRPDGVGHVNIPLMDDRL